MWSSLQQQGDSHACTRVLEIRWLFYHNLNGIWFYTSLEHCSENMQNCKCDNRANRMSVYSYSSLQQTVCEHSGIGNIWKLQTAYKIKPLFVLHFKCFNKIKWMFPNVPSDLLTIHDTSNMDSTTCPYINIYKHRLCYVVDVYNVHTLTCLYQLYASMSLFSLILFPERVWWKFV